jgi:hypothetical protein
MEEEQKKEGKPSFLHHFDEKSYLPKIKEFIFKIL